MRDDLAAALGEGVNFDQLSKQLFQMGNMATEYGSEYGDSGG